MKKADEIPHPGKFDDILNDIRRFSEPSPSNDFRIDYAKHITPHFQHNFGFVFANKRSTPQQHVEGSTSYQMMFQTEKREFFQVSLDSALNYSGTCKIPVISDKTHGDTFSINVIAQRQQIQIPKDQFGGAGRNDFVNVLVLDTDNKFEKSSLTTRIILRDQNQPSQFTLSYMQALSKFLSVGIQTEQALSSSFQSAWAYVVKWLSTDIKNAFLITRAHSVHINPQGEFAISTELKHKELKDEHNGESTLHADFQLAPQPQPHLPPKLNSCLTVGAETKSKTGEFRISFNSLYQLRLQLVQVIPVMFGGQLSFSALLDYAKESWQYGLSYQANIPLAQNLHSPDII